jgi:hypothetical protein
MAFMHISIISVGLSLFATSALATESNCSTDEVVVFSCAIGKSGKVVSMCASPGLTSKSGTLYYRFGASSKIELEYPSKPNGAAKNFGYAHYSRYQTERYEVTFSIGRYNYTIFDYYEENENQKDSRGVRVATEWGHSKETILSCKGQGTSKLSQLEGKVSCDAENALTLGQCN